MSVKGETEEKGRRGSQGPRINEGVTANEVLVIGPDGGKVGVMSAQAALDAATEAGLDLVEVSPDTDPVVCKIVDYGKYRFELQKRRSEQRRRQRTMDLKEIKLRPAIDKHDYEIKLRNVRRFIDNGDRVKVTMRFRGREIAHQNVGIDVLDRLRLDVEANAKVEKSPVLEGRQLTMILTPR